MRISVWVTALGICVVPLDAVVANPPAMGQAAPAPASLPNPTAQAGEASGTDAARHAKRTACIKEAKMKKLLGEQRNTYIKSCLAG